MQARGIPASTYGLALAGAVAIGLLVSSTPLAKRIDNYAVDFLFSMHPPGPWQTESMILALDDASYQHMGGVVHMRRELAKGLTILATVKPKVVAVDVLLADEGDAAENQELAAAFKACGNVILAAQLLKTGWETPLPLFSNTAKSIGHVSADADYYDGITRHAPLERAAGKTRLWALAMEAYMKAHNVSQVVESPTDLDLNGVVIPVRRNEDGRSLRVRFLAPLEGGVSAIPHITLKELIENPANAEAARDNVIFVGATAQSAMRDRYMTPYTKMTPMPGVEIHAQLYETIASHRFLVDENPTSGLLLGIGLAIAAGATFFFLSGVPAYLLGGLLLLVAHAIPHLFFLRGIVFPYFAPVVITWLSVSTAASFAHFLTRRQLRNSESEKSRYQQAIHFVAHEMRSPLSAIQGSSELMTRYNMNDDKRKQMAQMINAESKRLAKMIQTFLDVERLTDGQIQLKKEPFALHDLMEVCLDRVAPLAERKQIRVTTEKAPQVTLEGDRELMEYAFYNLLNNAIKYSPAETRVTVRSSVEGPVLRLSVKDEGIGMDEKELKQIFQKFYRTKKAEASGEAGTGIGLSIVEQIVTHHGGQMEVTSKPGQGSCFTMVLPVGGSQLCHASS